MHDFNIEKVYIDKLDDIVSKYKNRYQSTIKMKSVDVKSSTFIDFDKENNKKDTRFKVSDHVRISKYKNVFQKDPNWNEEVFATKKVKNTILWICPISYLNGEEVNGMFYKKTVQS